MKLTIEKEIPNHQFADLMVTALEMPFGSWVGGYRWSDEARAYVFNGKKEAFDKLPPDHMLVTVRMEDVNDATAGHEHQLTLQKLCEALQKLVLSESYSEHAMRCINGEEDVIDADALLQMAVYGEVVYG